MRYTSPLCVIHHLLYKSPFGDVWGQRSWNTPEDSSEGWGFRSDQRLSSPGFPYVVLQENGPDPKRLPCFRCQTQMTCSPTPSFALAIFCCTFGFRQFVHHLLEAYHFSAEPTKLAVQYRRAEMLPKFSTSSGNSLMEFSGIFLGKFMTSTDFYRYCALMLQH